MISKFERRFTIRKIVLLTSVLKAFINRLFWENFNITFMRNIKKLSKKSIVFLFLYKKFLKESITLVHLLTYSIKKLEWISLIIFYCTFHYIYDVARDSLQRSKSSIIFSTRLGTDEKAASCVCVFFFFFFFFFLNACFVAVVCF